MALVSRQDFADMCAIDMDSMRSYISRKKIIVQGLKGELIDTTHPLNKAFKENRKAKVGVKKQERDLIARIPPALPAIKKIKDDDDEDEDLGSPSPEAMMALFAGNKGGRRGKGEDDGDDIGGMGKYIKMKIKGDAELVALKVEKEQLLLDRAAGKLIPIDVASDVLRSHAKVIFSNLENALENIGDIFCTIAGAGADIRARFMDEARKELRTHVGNAGKDANVELDNIVANYSENKTNKL